MNTLFFFLLAACDETTPTSDDPIQEADTSDDADSGTHSDTNGETDSDTNGETEDAFAPVTGLWTVTTSELTQDGCGLEDAVDRGAPGTTLELLGAAEDFEMLFEAGEAVRCAITDGQNFTCQPTDSVDNTAQELGMSADILVTITTSGSFDDAATMWMESVVDIDCDGEDCGLVAFLLGNAFPCTMAMASNVAAD